MSFGWDWGSLARLRSAEAARTAHNAIIHQTGKPGRGQAGRAVPGLSQTALSRASGRDISSLTPALDHLEARGLVFRRRVPSDRRSYALSLTAKGERLLKELLGHARVHEGRLDEIVGDKYKAEFIRTLRRIVMTLV